MVLFVIVPAYLVFHMIVGSAMGAPAVSPRNPEVPVSASVPASSPK